MYVCVMKVSVFVYLYDTWLLEENAARKLARFEWTDVPHASRLSLGELCILSVDPGDATIFGTHIIM